MVGQTSAYILTISNVSSQPTTSITTVNDQMPSGLVLVSASGAGWDCSGSTAQLALCTYANPIALNDPPLTLTITVQVMPAAVPSVINVATVATSGDVDQTNDDDVVQNPVSTDPRPAPAPLLDTGGIAVALALLLAIAARKLRGAQL